jgi:MFS family permease
MVLLVKFEKFDQLDAATYMVPIALLANCAGRIFGGITIDLIGKWITRPYFMFFCCLGCSVASLLSAFANFQLLFVCTVFQGFFLGLSMLVGVALPMDMFGPSNSTFSKLFLAYYGTNFSLCLGGPALFNFLFSTVKFSIIYNYNVLPGNLKCYDGHQCYMWSFLIVSACALVGSILSLILGVTSKERYVALANKN